MSAEQLDAPGLEQFTPSWFPVIFRLENGSHLHGALWWTWKGSWKDDTLPRGVELLTIITARRGCELCEEWKSVLGWPKEVPKPESPGPNDVQGRPEDLFQPETTPVTTSGDDGGGPSETTNPYNDF